MKRKITRKYLYVFISSVIVVVVLWCTFSYMMLFGNRVSLDKKVMHTCIMEVFGEVDKNTMKLTNNAKRMLDDYAFWVQVVNIEGTVVDEYKAPLEAPKKYNLFELSNYVLNSNTIYGQTMYAYTSNKSEKYGVVVGCDTSQNSKVTVEFNGKIIEQIINCGAFLIILLLVIGFVFGRVFSKTISEPIQDIISNINHLEADVGIPDKKRKKNLFDSVYESLYKLQYRLKSADRERAAAEEERNEWISNISHDMKTPLSSIKGYAELMADQEYEISDEERKQFSDIIIKNANNIEYLVKELRENRRLENGKRKLNKESMNINSIIKECCSEMPADYSMERLSYSFEKSLLYAEVDKRLIKRCFSNIICNAFIHNDQSVKVKISTFSKDGKACVVIEDNGMGVSQEEKEQIFGRYYRGDSSGMVEGSGLGLAIVKEIVEAHDGTIVVESILGEGSKFIVTL